MSLPGADDLGATAGTAAEKDILEFFLFAVDAGSEQDIVGLSEAVEAASLQFVDVQFSQGAGLEVVGRVIGPGPDIEGKRRHQGGDGNHQPGHRLQYLELAEAGRGQRRHFGIVVHTSEADDDGQVESGGQQCLQPDESLEGREGEDGGARQHAMGGIGQVGGGTEAGENNRQHQGDQHQGFGDLQDDVAADDQGRKISLATARAVGGASKVRKAAASSGIISGILAPGRGIANLRWVMGNE